MLENITYLAALCIKMVGRTTKLYKWPGPNRYGLTLRTNLWRCRYLCTWTKIQIFKLLVITVLLRGCEVRALNTDLKKVNLCLW